MNDSSKTVQWYQKLRQEETEIPGADLSKKEVKAARKQLNFEKHIEESYRWIHEVAFMLGEEYSYGAAYQALRGVLFAMRDRMTPAEVFQFSAQLPIHIRGLFFEGYKIKDKPDKYHEEEFLRRISSAIPSGAYDAKLAFKAVLQVIYNHVSKGELKDIYATYPKDLQALWNQVLK